MEAQWRAGSYLDNFNTGVQYLGFDHIPLALGLAKVNWPDTDTRDAFLRAISVKKEQ